MDKDGTLKIDWSEWRDYLILSPSTDLHDILHYWRHSTVGFEDINTIFPKCSGPSCSKLMTSLVNDSLKFTSSDTQIC